MTPTQQTVQKILAVTGNESATAAVKNKLTELVDAYYNSRGSMAKTFTVGLIIDELGLKWGEYAGKLSECFIG